MWDKDGLSIPTSMKQTQQESMHEHLQLDFNEVMVIKADQAYSPNDHSQTPQKQPTNESRKGEKPHSKEHTTLNEKNRILFLNLPPPKKN